MVQTFKLCFVYLCLFSVFEKRKVARSVDSEEHCDGLKEVPDPELPVSLHPPFPPHGTCFWTVITERSRYLKINITNFKLNPGVFCGEKESAKEFVDVSDGHHLLGKFCGDARNISWSLYSSMEAMMINMTYFKNEENQPGFQATFSSVLSEDRLCPPRWVHFQSSCYFLSPTQGDKKWSDARADCLAKGADLMDISSDDENTLVEISGTRRWIGLRRVHKMFRWLDNTLVSYHKFTNVNTLHSGPGKASRKCVYVQQKRWYDKDCESVRMKYVCEKADAGTPFAPKFDYVVAGCQQILVKWSAPSTHSGTPITEYLAHVSQFPTLSDGSQNCTLNSNTTLKCLFHGLTNGIKFYVRIEARNKKGGSNPARVIVVPLTDYQRHFKGDWSTEGGLRETRATRNGDFKAFENCTVAATTTTVLTTKTTITWNTEPKTELAANDGSGLPLSLTSIIGISVGSSLLLLIIVVLVRSVRKKFGEHRLITYPKSEKPNIQVLDQWNVLPEQVTYMEELGRGAFGTVHRAKVMSFRKAMERRKSGDVAREPTGRIVAVKVLREPSEELQMEFLREMEIMKQVGTHPNIVSLVGCWTVTEPFLLIVEYAPYGDLLHWLRRGRRRMGILKYQQSPRSGYGNREERLSNTDILENEADKSIKDDDRVPSLATPETKENVNRTDVSIQDDIVKETNTRERDNNVHENETGAGVLETDSGSEHEESLHLLMKPQRSSTNRDFAHLKQVEIQSDPSGSKRGERISSKVRFSSFQGNQTPEGIRPTVVSRPHREERVESRLFCTKDDEENYLGPLDFLSFAWQISRGMQYLASKDLIHRDLAARNVLVSERKTLKVADFGLTRQATSGTYRSRPSKKIPIKWMAPEAIYSQEFTVKTDVWSMGVVLWEITTMGEVPYPTVSNKDVYQLIKTGHRMSQPELCSDDIYDIMAACWREDPDDRPTFAQLTESLERLIQTDVPYLLLDSETSFPDEEPSKQIT